MQNAFNPQDMALLAKVVDDACRKLGCDEAQRATVASRVLSFASRGTRDYDTLLAIAEFEREAEEKTH